MSRINIEVTVEEIQGALEAQRVGADRLEVCTALDLGGLTPSAGLIGSICDRVTIPVIAIIRPRSGNFVIDESDIALAEEENLFFFVVVIGHAMKTSGTNGNHLITASLNDTSKH